jgi:hypothetical protein
VTAALLHPAVPLAGADVAFYVVFAAFAAALVVLSAITLRWAVRRDRAGRAQWLERHGEGGPEAVPPNVNGHGPRRRGARRPGAPG